MKRGCVYRETHHGDSNTDITELPVELEIRVELRLRGGEHTSFDVSEAMFQWLET